MFVTAEFIGEIVMVNDSEFYKVLLHVQSRKAQQCITTRLSTRFYFLSAAFFKINLCQSEGFGLKAPLQWESLLPPSTSVLPSSLNLMFSFNCMKEYVHAILETKKIYISLTGCEEDLPTYFVWSTMKDGSLYERMRVRVCQHTAVCYQLSGSIREIYSRVR
jgi:hypothetical protein